MLDHPLEPRGLFERVRRVRSRDQSLVCPRSEQWVCDGGHFGGDFRRLSIDGRRPQDNFQTAIKLLIHPVVKDETDEYAENRRGKWGQPATGRLTSTGA
jgi:hypothetical protein